MRLLGTRILVKKNEAEESETLSGILLLPNEKEVEKIGEVVLVGPGLSDEKMIINVGETVKYEGNGLHIDYEGMPCVMISQSNVLAVI